MHVNTKGKGSDVILIHGLSANMHTWSDTIKELQDTYTTHTVDLIGFGESVNEWSLLFKSTMKNQARRVISELDKRGIKKFSLVGHSMGGGVSLYIANMIRTNRKDLTLEKMLLVAPVAYPPGVGISDVQDLFKDDVEALVYDLLKAGYYDPTKIKLPDQVEAYAENYKTWKGFPALAAHAISLSRIVNLEKHYPNITTTTKLVWGEEDEVLKTALHAPKLHAALPNATLETISECGHNAVEECGEKTNAIIKSFLDS